jgi:hypothetical protein
MAEVPEIGQGYVIMTIHTGVPAVPTVPIGVATWNADAEWWAIRMLDFCPNLVGQQQMVFIKLLEDNLRYWASEQSVPYCLGTALPYTSRFWSAVRDIRQTNTRLNPLVAQADPKIDELYQSLVVEKNKLLECTHVRL